MGRGRRKKLSDEQRQEIERKAWTRLEGELQVLNGTIVPEDCPAVGVSQIREALLEDGGLRQSASSLWRIARKIEEGSYAWVIDGCRVTMVSSAVNDARSLMPAEAAERRSALDYSAFGRMGGRPRRSVSQ